MGTSNFGFYAKRGETVDKLFSILLKVWDKASKSAKVTILTLLLVGGILYAGMQLQAGIHGAREEWREYQSIKTKVAPMPSAEDMRDVVKAAKQIAPLHRSMIQIKQHLKIKLDWREKKFLREWELLGQEWNDE